MPPPPTDGCGLAPGAPPDPTTGPPSGSAGVAPRPPAPPPRTLPPTGTAAGAFPATGGSPGVTTLADTVGAFDPRKATSAVTSAPDRSLNGGIPGRPPVIASRNAFGASRA